MLEISQLVAQCLQNHKGKRIRLSHLESYILKYYQDLNRYDQAGGYSQLYYAIRQLEQEGILYPVQIAKGNGRIPELKTAWHYNRPHPLRHWDPLQILRVSDRLSMKTYATRPELQTPEEWERVEQVYRFLQESHTREWATREERSFELFRDEKWLSEKTGRSFLTRVGLSLQDLKAKVLGEPFVFWFVSSKDTVHPPRQILIVENLSAFHTCKRVLEVNATLLLPESPDVLVYGEGKKIESSLPFLQEITSAQEVVISYAGDIDPEGLSIFIRLQEKHPAYTIQLCIPFYKKLVERMDLAVPIKKQQQVDLSHLNTVLDELNRRGEPELAQKLLACWESGMRLPQEIVTYEHFVREEVRPR